MLPRLGPDGAIDWEASGPGAFRTPLPDYLREFLLRLDVDIPVHDRLNGWLLLPYQAAVRKDQWSLSWDVLAQPFCDMRRAYRRQFGGSCAPELSTSSEPRLLRIVSPGQGYEDVLEQASEPLAEAEDSALESAVPIRRTFVHYKRASSSLRRADSEPLLQFDFSNDDKADSNDDKAETASQSDCTSTTACSVEGFEDNEH